MKGKSNRRLPYGVTEEQLKQFWNHKINPITGFRTKGIIGRKKPKKQEEYGDNFEGI